MIYTRDMAKVLISVPDDLLTDIDHEAEARGMSRSRFLREAALHELGWPDPRALESAMRRGRAALAGIGAFDAAEVIAAQRRERDVRDQRR